MGGGGGRGRLTRLVVCLYSPLPTGDTKPFSDGCCQNFRHVDNELAPFSNVSTLTKVIKVIFNCKRCHVPVMARRSPLQHAWVAPAGFGIDRPARHGSRLYSRTP